VFTPHTDSMALGYVELDVALAARDRGQGFCPAQLRVLTWDRSAGVTHTELSHAAPAPLTLQVMPGIVAVTSYGGGLLNAYCFGGRLAAHAVAGAVLCELTSPAPILNLSEEGLDLAENAVLHVADALEAALATERAARNADQEVELEADLAQVDPRHLYAAGLILAQKSLAMLPEIIRTEHYWDEYAILSRAIEEARLADWWPDAYSIPAIIGRSQNGAAPTHP
jgi:hypothetical protein